MRFPVCIGAAALGVLMQSQPSLGRDIDGETPFITNFYGQAGLIDMPSARFAPDGELTFGASFMHVQERYSVSFEALPWLETTFRYARADRWHGLREDDYDRSLGVKIRLSNESEYLPSLAIGAQDILGTGVYGAEYVVASKRLGDLDFTAGIGWRRFGQLATFKNPLRLLSESFKTIPSRIATTGAPLLNQLFHGPNAGLFGGVTWDTPIDGLTLIAEASGDKYTKQDALHAIDYRSPLNFSFVYHPWNDVQIGGGYLYGSEFGLELSFRLNGFDPPPQPKLGPEPPPPAVRAPETRRDAVLSLLQDTTHYYNNWPSFRQTPAPTLQPMPQATRQTTVPHLADALFQEAAYRKLEISNVESFGDSLLVSIRGNPGRVDCASFEGLSRSAAADGFKQITFSGQANSDVTLCGMPAGESAPLRRYASNGGIEQPVDSTPDAPAADLSTPATAPSTPGTPLPVDQTIINDSNGQQVGINSISITDTRIDVAIYNSRYQTDTEAIGRVLRVLMYDAPPSVEIFRIVIMISGVPVTEVTLSRSEVERILDSFGSGQELLLASMIKPATPDDPLIINPTNRTYPYLGYSFTPGYRQTLFDPDQPYRYQLYVTVGGFADITRDISLSAAFDVDIVNTVQAITRTSNSKLPHVRSDFAEYYKKGIDGISYLQASYLTKLTDDTYFYGKAGLLESMYAGVGGEIYWQPAHTRWSLGAELFAVQQRGFDRLFDMRNYRVITGHASLYYDSPFYDLDFALHVGRYLAGDYGATFQITRRFDNGMEIGAYATLTNVPFSVFGEGSFDKGFIIHIPLGDLLPVNTQEVANLDFSPLTRDGGQRVAGEATLHGMLQRSSEGELLRNWDEVLRP